MPSDARASQSVLTIDLGAIAANYRAMRERVAPRADCAAVVKADAYGLGAVRVAPALARAGCRIFFVAQLGEAVALRSAVADADIYVLNGLLHGEEKEYRRLRLIPVLNDLGQIALWQKARNGDQKLPAAIHFDTGMSRLGLSPHEADTLAAEPQRLDGIDLRYVISHLACADETNHPLNREQLRRFAAIRARFPHSKGSFANSSGVCLGSDYHFDLVRPGCALYGINPTPEWPNPMRTVVRLDVPILQIREIDRPASVGYGATHHVTGKTRVATVAVGYADGWLRAFSNRGTAIAAGVRVPFIGRVSMDLVTLDVTSVPALHVGDMVALMDEQLDVDTVATTAGTIGYEILTGLGARYHRHYVGDPTA